MAFVVIYDACVLYPAPIRDLLLRIANTGVVRARWSERILDECFDSIVAQRPDLPPAALERTRRLMREAIPDCIVDGYQHLEDGLDLPDPDDRHVLAAAIRANAQAIVTFNLRDFPDHVLSAMTSSRGTRMSSSWTRLTSRQAPSCTALLINQPR